MAASQEQKVDFLLKKIGYVASKTGIAEDSSLSGTKKAPFGEAIPSPLVTPASSVWAEAAEIPATPPGSDTSFVRVYLSGSSGHRMTVDNTVSGNRTFIARSTYNDDSSAILGDWIDTSFGADYIIEVYRGDPNSGGVKLSAAGSGSNDTWFFDYSSGVLNFNGTSVPSGITSSNIYIVGYRYIGIKGVAVPGAGATFTFATIGDLNITGVSTFFDTTDNTLGNENTGSVQLDGGMGIAKNLTVKQNLHVGGYAEFVGVATFKGGTINLGDADTDDINIGGEFISDLVPDVDDSFSLGTASKQWKNLFINGHAELDNVNIAGVSTFSSPLDINTDVDIDGHTELDNVSISGVTTFQSNAFFGDADYIQMGDSQDLKIGHVGSYSVILDQGEGNLSIGGDGFVDIMNTALDEYKARFTTNGSVELYFDNVNKFETTGYGATVFGTLQSQQLNVSGVSTYAGDADFNGHVDIDGHTELDNVNVSGIITATESDIAFLTTKNYSRSWPYNNWTGSQQGVTLATTGRNLIIQAGGITSTRSYVSLTNGGGAWISGGYGNSEGVNIDAGSGDVKITGGSVGIGSTQPTAILDVNGQTELDELNVTGIATFTNTVNFSSSLNLSGDLDVDGHSNLDNVSVAGVTTFTGAITANGAIDLNADLDVDGHTNLDNVDIAGVTTTSGLLDINAGGQANTFKVEDLTDNRVVIAGTGGELEDDANLTFNGSTLSVGVDLDVDGHTELDNVNISGVTTVAGNIDANGDLDVDGHTNLDNVSVAGVSTFTGNVDLNAALDVSGNITGTGDITLTDTDTGSAAGPELKLFRNSASPADADYLGQIKFAGESDTGVERNYAKITGKILDASNGTEDGIIEFAHIKAGSQNISARFRSDSLQLLNGTNFSVAGDSTFTGAIDANGDLDVDGHTNLDNVSVSGVSTFSGNINLPDNVSAIFGTNDDGSIKHTGTNLQIFETTGGIQVTNYANDKDVDIRSDDGSGGTALYFRADGSTGEALLYHYGNEKIKTTSTGVSITGNNAVSGNVTVSGDLDVDGHTELDNVNISGVATATAFHTGAEGSAIRVTSNTISGPAEMFIDPAGVGDNTGALRIKGDLFVDGTQTVINSTTIELGDFIVGIATTATTDSLADGAGIKIGPDNTFLYDHSNTSLKSSENLNLASSKTYKINGTDVLSATTLGSGVVNSSLTSLGTLLGLTVSGQTTLNTLGVTGVSTFTGAITANGAIDLNADLDVDGHTNLDNVSVAGVTTFAGLIEASAGENKIPSLYANLAALPSASTYHGMFAHVHSTGRAYFAHAGNWLELVNKNVAGNVGTGTEGYNVGIITATGIDLNGDLDVDGHTNLDNVSVAGVTTFASRIVGAATNNVIPFLYSNYGDLPSAGTYHGAFAHVHSMGKGLFAHGGAWYELVNKELNGTVGTGTERYNVGQIDATDVDVSGITTSVSLHVGVGGTVITASGIGSVGINSTTPAYALDVVGDINSSTDIKVNGVSIVSSGGNASLDDVVALAIALG